MKHLNTNSATAPDLDTRAAAKYLGMHFTTLRSWRREGKGPAFVKFEGGTVRYRLSALEQFASGTAAPTEQGE